ncbi:MAG: DUF5050 domain-containing protein [Treponema sp.]|nr:DUF5050 domain-containing protein [Treponema sp.]
MSEIFCAVCKKGKGPTQCEVCGFSDNGVIYKEFLNPDDLNDWLKTVVEPYRMKWEFKEREIELLARIYELESQLEVFKKQKPSVGAQENGAERSPVQGDIKVTDVIANAIGKNDDQKTFIKAGLNIVKGLLLKHEYGNTPGNIINFGIVAKKGDYIYYHNAMDGGKIYKMRADGTQRQKLNNNESCFINVLGEWIYYIDFSGKGNIYKMRTDGTQPQKLNDEASYSLSVVGEWVYYLTSSDESKIYKMRTDGTQRQKLNNDKIDEPFNLTDEWIYYANRDDGRKIYKIRTDGTQRQKLNNDYSSYINLEGDWVYYSNVSDGRKIYRMRTDGSLRQKLNNEQSAWINVSNGWVYYISGHGNHTIYCKMRIDGSQQYKIQVDKGMIFLNIADEWLYYTAENVNYKMRIDGTSCITPL